MKCNFSLVFSLQLCPADHKYTNSDVPSNSQELQPEHSIYVSFCFDRIAIENYELDSHLGKVNCILFYPLSTR